MKKIINVNVNCKLNPDPKPDNITNPSIMPILNGVNDEPHVSD